MAHWQRGRCLGFVVFVISSIVFLKTVTEKCSTKVDIRSAVRNAISMKQMNTNVLTSGRTEDYRIPADSELAQMNASELTQIYWKYVNMLQVLCKDVIRVGNLKDGGKEICVDNGFKPKSPCIVYSFGVGYKYDFDNAVVDLFGCDVYCFDPSMNESTHQISEHMWFYNVGLGGNNFINNENWEIKTLDTIRRELGHTDRTINILKIDIEGGEGYSILQMISSGALSGVQQIAMELHFNPTKWTYGPPYQKLSALRQLYDNGYRIFMRERNIYARQRKSPGIYGKVSYTNEISLIKTDS